MAEQEEAEQYTNSDALAVYGSLAPGETNHWVVSRIKGEWVTGTTHGYTFEITWGPAEGYQGFIPDDDAGHVPLAVLRSDALDRSWREIDEFEGPGYERMRQSVTLESGDVIEAWIYVALTDS